MDNTIEPVSGILIKMFPYRDHDLILRFLLEDGRKETFIAHRSRAQSKKYSGHFDLFDYGTIEAGKKRGSLTPVRSFSRIYTPTGIREDLDRITVATALCEAVDQLIPEEAETNADIFESIRLGIVSIAESSSHTETFKACFLTLGSVLSLLGHVDTETLPNPSAHGLLQLLKHVEDASGKKLESGPMILDSLERLRKSVSSASTT